MQKIFEKIKQRLEERRKEYEEKSEKIPYGVQQCYYKGLMRGYEYSSEIVDQVAEEYKGGWIPCSVVLHPEHMHDCEVTVQDSFGLRREIAFFTDKWRRTSDELQLNVIAWKEPSQPYKY